MKNLIVKLNNWKINFINEFKEDKLKFVLKYIVLLISFICLATLPSFTYREQFNNITNILSILLAISALAYVLFKGRIVINYYIFCLLLLLIFSSFITLLTTRKWETIRSMLTLYLISCVIFTCIVNFKNPNFYLISFFIGFCLLAVWFVIDNKDYILSLNFNNRLGDTFGNLNTVGGMLALGGIILSYYIFKKKRWYFFLLLVEGIFGFLVILTGSKTAILLFAVGIIFSLYFAFGRKKIIWYVITVILIISLGIGILMLPPFSMIRERFISMISTLFSGDSYDLSTAQRYNMFVDGVDLWLKNIFFGNGSESFSILTSYGTYSHNSISELLCNFGLLGFFLFYSPYVFVLFKKNRGKFWPLLLPFVILFIFVSSINVIFLAKHVIITGAILMAASYLDNDCYDRAIIFDFKILDKRFMIEFKNFKRFNNFHTTDKIKVSK